ncbi:MAG: MBL fold metallo-hydrolase [Candidatus Pacebacteria bacterium]|nr:MBL fold metallo-hydrolase [Candidatus Paceibacterota bacterium]
MAQISITFARGARRVTGSNFLVTVVDGARTTRILIDCGLTQGEQFCDPTNGETFTYDPTEIGAVFFTHAHADHIGLFPKLVKEGFKGRAYATAPTRDLMPVMLEDSVSLMRSEATRCGTDVPYVMDDVVHALKMLTDIPYGETVTVGDARVTLLNAGHILGSALVQIDAGGKRVVFTGDLGRVPSILAPDRDVPEGVDVLVTESVYGNRTHASVSDSEQELAAAVQRSYQEQGTLLIPAFSLERTQIILAALDRMMTEGTLPKVPVYMDSPLAAKVTDIYRAYPAFLRPEVRERLERGDDPFSFPTLRVTVNTESSHLIDVAPSPKIVIAGAGMSHGGRIRHHEQKYLPLKNTTLLLVGYQVAGSLGRRLKDGRKEVAIDGVKVKVRARVAAIGGFSAHADRDDIVGFVEAVKPRRVFVVLGETEAATFLAQRISGFLGLPTDVPQEGETYEL